MTNATEPAVPTIVEDVLIAYAEADAEASTFIGCHPGLYRNEDPEVLAAWKLIVRKKAHADNEVLKLARLMAEQRKLRAQAQVTPAIVVPASILDRLFGASS